VQYAAAAVVAFVALGKVLSPQYMIWLIAVIPLVRRWSAWALYVAALALTQAWFPQKYWSYALGFSESVTWLVLARDLVLLALLVVLLAPMPRRRPRLALSTPARAPAGAGANGRRRASSSRA